MAIAQLRAAVAFTRPFDTTTVISIGKSRQWRRLEQQIPTAAAGASPRAPQFAAPGIYNPAGEAAHRTCFLGHIAQQVCVSLRIASGHVGGARSMLM